MAVTERPAATDPIYEGTRIPSPIPTVLEVPPELRASDDILTINFGPNHPSTHGVLRLVVDLDGEVVVGINAKVGYVHTGFEKNMEAKTWWKAITYAPRIDYLAYQNNELVFVLAAEKLLGLEVPATLLARERELPNLVAASNDIAIRHDRRKEGGIGIFYGKSYRTQLILARELGAPGYRALLTGWVFDGPYGKYLPSHIPQLD